jgi:hypothetical protein
MPERVGWANAEQKGAAMFEPVFESLRKITETTAQAQQELFKKWVGLWPGAPAFPPACGEQVPKLYKKWAEVVHDALRRQREYIEAQFKAGLENIEKAFAVGEAKTPEELRAKTAELWKKCFESLRQAYEAQVREIQVTADKWVELVTKSAA